MAEKVGFEPTEQQSRSIDFESIAFDHSATSPHGKTLYTFFSPLPTASKIFYSVFFWRIYKSHLILYSGQNSSLSATTKILRSHKEWRGDFLRVLKEIRFRGSGKPGRLWYNICRWAEKWPSGRRRALGERLNREVPWVQIPPSPPFFSISSPPNKSFSFT